MEHSIFRFGNTGLFGWVFLFSIFVNALQLTGPLFMLQVYDRVLGSGSEETLLALFVLVAFLYGMMGLLDYARGRVLARAGARYQAGLDARVFSAALEAEARGGEAEPELAAAARGGLRDLEAVRGLLASPALTAVFDMPWTPAFLAVIFLFHVQMGWLAVAGGTLLIALALLNQRLTQHAAAEAQSAGRTADRLAGGLADEAEAVQALGMRKAVLERWNKTRGMALERGIATSDRTGGFAVASRTLRMFLQSAMLALGAWLVLQGALTAGAMIAASILLGRALAPVEQAIGQWPAVSAALRGHRRLALLLSKVPERPTPMPLPEPRALLEARQVSVLPPRAARPALRGVSFRLNPGEAMGVIGPSGSGKTTLARALVGAWPVAAGSLRLDAAAIDQYAPERLAAHIGYLPQRVGLFEGTLADNIARLSPAPDPAQVVEAARRAAVHELILSLPQGYDTRVATGGGQLSGGQIQRIGLARAIYGKPVILVLDEPNASLDAEGSAALNKVVAQMKAEGRAVIIMAHRPAAIRECDTLLVLDGGAQRAFGKRDEVLRDLVSNHASIAGGAAATTRGKGAAMPPRQRAEGDA